MNKAILMGRLTRDPEVRYSQNNLPITNFTLAIDRRFTRQGEEKQADFIPIVTFGKTAEFCEKYFRKGQQVLVVGRIQTRTWDDNDGKRRYMTEVICEEAYFADSKRQDYGEVTAARPDEYGYYPSQQQGANQSPYGPGAQAFSGGGMGTGAGFGSGAGPNSGADDLQSQFQPGAAANRGGPARLPSNGEDQTNADDGFLPIENDSDLPF